MLPPQLAEAFGQLMPALLEVARREPALRKSLLTFVQEFERSLSADPQSSAASEPAPAKKPKSNTAAEDEAAPKGKSEEDRRRIRSAREFRADIALVPSRSALKAQGCRLALRLLEDGETPELLREIEEARTKAKDIPECQLWMLDPRAPEMTPADLKQTSECYSNLSRAVDLADRDEQRRGLEEAPAKRLMLVVAEAQSAVYATLSARGLRGDRDQLQTFGWLRERTDYYRVFIPRFMDRNRLANPDEWEDLGSRIERQERALEEALVGEAG